MTTGLILALVLAAAEGSSELPPVDNHAEASSSLGTLIERLAGALEGRALLEKVSGPVRLEVLFQRGIDRTKAERSLLPRLRKRLRDGGVLIPAAASTMRCTVTLSEEGGQVWAVAVIEGGALLGPSAVAVQHAVDRELEATLGASVKPAQTRFVLERLGPLPPGVLDILLIDLDGDTAEEIAVLSVDGVRLYRAAQGRLERVGAPARLPGSRRWPRVATGWIAARDAQTLWIQTSAGHAHTFDTRALRFDPAPADLVPLRGTEAPASPPYAGGFRHGSPVVALPLVTVRGEPVREALGMPTRVRDVAQPPGARDVWIYVDDAGGLFSLRGEGQPNPLAAERVGDRIALADLDGDGAIELLTTSASAPGEPDHLVLRRLDEAVQTSTVLFRSPLSGGSVVAVAVGHLDYGDRKDGVLAEQVGAETLLWRLKHTP
jgi:hypothetical protein